MRDSLLALIQSLYAAPGRPEGWQAFLLELCNALDGSAASFIAHDTEVHRGNIALTARTDPVALREYNDYWWRFDPWAHSPTSGALISGTVVSGEQLISHPDVQRTAYYNEFGRRYDITRSLAGMIEVRRGVLSCLSVNRSDARGTFSADDRSLFEALMPHLRCALELHRRLASAEALAADAMGALDALTYGVIFLDAHGCVLHANRFAAELLRHKDGLTTDAQFLRAATVEDTDALRRAIALAVGTSGGSRTSAGSLVLLGRSSQRPLRALAAPVSWKRSLLVPATAAAMVLIGDPEKSPRPSEEELRERFDLTPAEARLARGLADGLSLEQAASHFDLRVGTVRTRLKSIFEKTGTHRQTDLIRLLLAGRR